MQRIALLVGYIYTIQLIYHWFGVHVFILYIEKSCTENSAVYTSITQKEKYIRDLV